MFRKFGYGDVGVSNHVHLAEDTAARPSSSSILIVGRLLHYGSLILNSVSVFCSPSPSHSLRLGTVLDGEIN
jgi:hypothetical protein